MSEAPETPPVPGADPAPQALSRVEGPQAQLPAPRPPPDAATRRRLAIDVAVVLALAVVPDVVSAVWSLVVYGPQLPPSTIGGEIYLIARSLQVALPLLYLHVRSGDPLSLLGLVRTPLGWVLGGGLLIWGLDTGLAIATQEALGLAPPGDPSVMHDPPRGWLLLWRILGDAANAFAEELAMRAFLFDRLERLTGRTGFAIVVSALCFASYHVYQGDSGFVFALQSGLLWGAVFAITRRLGPLVVAHALTNLLGMY